MGPFGDRAKWAKCHIAPYKELGHIWSDNMKPSAYNSCVMQANPALIVLDNITGSDGCKTAAAWYEIYSESQKCRNATTYIKYYPSFIWSFSNP